MYPDHTLLDPDKSRTYLSLPGKRTKAYCSTGVDPIPYAKPEVEAVFSFTTSLQRPGIGGFNYGGQLTLPVFAFCNPAGGINGIELTFNGLEISKSDGQIPYTKLDDSWCDYCRAGQSDLYIDDEIFSKNGPDANVANLRAPCSTE
ncbi:hypothetical protein TruAng_001317 [Truncatella angustata]|nr:hypothetical protein TruAng_001317 [Truncatella angustata]